MGKVLSIDAETNGLWGRAFIISAVLQEEDGSISEFVARCPIDGNVDSWVSETVLPQVESIPETHETYVGLLSAFTEFYKQHKEGADVIVHMGVPVEARLFIDAHYIGLIGDWDGPYPLIDISAFPCIGDSVDKYLADKGISVECEGKTHNPLYDAYATLYAYNDVVAKL